MGSVITGEMKTDNLAAALSGDEPRFNSLGWEAKFYKLSLKSHVHNIRPDAGNATDGSLALSGTGQCSTQ